MSGQTSIFSLGPKDGKVLFVLGDIVILKLSAAETNGAYSLVKSISAPGGGAAFLHTHISQETFCVLEGEYELYGRDENGEKYAIPASAGATVHVPGNVAHGFRNVGKTMVRMLTMYEPASDMIDFFMEVGVPMDSPTDPLPVDKMPGPERIAEALEKHKIRMLESPDAAG